MGIDLFYDELRSVLSSTRTLQEVENVIQKEIEKISGEKIGFVVGKVSPTNSDETKYSNLLLLEKRTREIAEKELKNGIYVFSSSVVPEFIENSAQVSEFYVFWERMVEKYADILYTTLGYELSKGAVHEITLAKKMGKEIRSYEEVIG